jgi:hypothetical protein
LHSKEFTLKSIDEIMRTVSGSNNPLEVLKAVPVTHDYSKLSESLGRTSNPARWTYERLGEYIKKFESELDEEHEIGVRLVSFGQTIVFHVEDIGYYGPDIITFYGNNEKGEKLQLIQNLSQLSHVHPEQFGDPGAGFFPGFDERTGAGELMTCELARTTYGLAPALGGLHPRLCPFPD